MSYTDKMKCLNSRTSLLRVGELNPDNSGAQITQVSVAS